MAALLALALPSCSLLAIWSLSVSLKPALLLPLRPTPFSPKCQSARGHSNKTKQGFRSTGFQRCPKASSTVSVGTNNGEAPAIRPWIIPYVLSMYMPPFRLTLSIGGYVFTRKNHVRIKLDHKAACDQHFGET